MGSAFGHIFVEGVEVHHHQVDGGNLVLLHLTGVNFIVAAGKDAAEHLGVEGLYAAAQNRGVACEVFYLLYLETLACEVVVCAACGEEFCAARGERCGDLVNAVLVEDGYQSSLYFLD